VITGTLPNLSREGARALIEKHGGHVTNAVSAKTDFLLAGEQAGSKLDAAKKLGVKIINEEEFLKMAGEKIVKAKMGKSEGGQLRLF
jgi:DNA ligase (NAD+)